MKFKDKLFQIDKNQDTRIRPRERIEVYQSFDKTIKLVKNNTNLSFHEIDKTASEALKNRATEAVSDLLEEVKNKLGPESTDADIFNELRIGHF